MKQNAIIYKKNYGNKLESQFYLSLLPARDDHKVGAIFPVYNKTKEIHNAKVIICEARSLNDLEDFETLLDVGVTADMYRKACQEHNPQIDLDRPFMNSILFERLPNKANEKIALFCKYYEQYTSIKYKISPREIGMIKNVEVTDDLLDKFFRSTEFWAKVKSVAYYVKNINEIRRITATHNQDGFPNFWDEKYASKLDPPTYMKYCGHLNSLGWKARKSATGTILEYVKPKL